MPPLVMFGRRFHFATDDLPLPAGLACIACTGSAIVIAIALATSDCPLLSAQQQSCRLVAVQAYLAALLGCTVVCAALQGSMSYVSSRGSIFNLTPRLHVSSMASALIVISCCTLGTNIYGTQVLYVQQQIQDLEAGVGFTIAWRTIKVMLAILWITWIVLIATVIGIIMAWNILGQHSAEHGWRSRCECMSSILCCMPALNKARARQRVSNTAPLHTTQQTAAGQITYTACPGDLDSKENSPGSTTDVQAGLHFASPAQRTYQPLSSGGGVAAQADAKNLRNSLGARGDESPADVELGDIGGANIDMGTTVSPVEPDTPGVAERGGEGKAGLKKGQDSRVQKLNEQDAPLDQLAQAFSHFFGHIDMTLSDIATLWLLEGVHQRLQRQKQFDKQQLIKQEQQRQQLQQQQQQDQPEQPSPPQKTPCTAETPSSFPEPEDAAATAASLGLLQSCPPSAAASIAKAHLLGQHSGLDQGLLPRSDPHLDEMPLPLDDAQHYFRHACAIYGWPMFVYAHRKESPHKWLGVCCCCTHLFNSKASRLHPLQLEHNLEHHYSSHQQQHNHHSGNTVSASPPQHTDGSGTGASLAMHRHSESNSVVLNVAPLLQLNAMERWTGLGARELLYCSLENAVAGVLPYYIVMDRSRKELVLAIRGSLSVSDVATDLLCQPTLITNSWFSGGWDLEITKLNRSGSSSKPNNPSSPSCPLTQPDLDHLKPVLDRVTDPSLKPVLEVLHDSLVNQVGNSSREQHPSSNGVDGEGSRSGEGHHNHSDASNGSIPNVRASAPLPMEWNDGQEEVSGTAGRVKDAHFAHGGMFLSAQAVAEDLDRHGILDALLGGSCSTENSRSWRLSGHPLSQQDCSGFRLVCLGHSLGAGVASLLALRLTARYQHAQQTTPPSGSYQVATNPSPDPSSTEQTHPKDPDQGCCDEELRHEGAGGPRVICWAFSPPGGLMSSALAASMTDYCTSVVVGRDMIPRLSSRSLTVMAYSMLRLGIRCKVPKATLWARSVLLHHHWTEKELLYDREEDAPMAARQLGQQGITSISASRYAAIFEPTQDFTIPGRMLFYERVKVHTSGRHSKHTGAKSHQQPPKPAHHSGTDSQALHMMASCTPLVDGQEDTSDVTAKANVSRPAGVESLSASTTCCGAPGAKLKHQKERYVPRWMSTAEWESGARDMVVTRSMFAVHVPDFQERVISEAAQANRDNKTKEAGVQRLPAV